MTRLIDRPYDPVRPLVVRRFFVAAGRHFSPGDLFDRRKVLCTPRRVRQLFDAGKLTHTAEGGAVSGPGALPLMGEVVTGSGLTPAQQEIQDETILALASAPPSAEAPSQVSEPVMLPEPEDDLTDLNMKELRAIAEAEDAPTRTSRADQRAAIRDNRAERVARPIAD